MSEELKELVKDNFITKEEQRFKKQVRISWYAIALSFIIGIIGTCSNSSDKTETIINSIEINDFKNNNTLDSIKQNQEVSNSK